MYVISFSPAVVGAGVRGRGDVEGCGERECTAQNKLLDAVSWLGDQVSVPTERQWGPCSCSSVLTCGYNMRTMPEGIVVWYGGSTKLSEASWIRLTRAGANAACDGPDVEQRRLRNERDMRSGYPTWSAPLRPPCRPLSSPPLPHPLLLCII